MNSTKGIDQYFNIIKLRAIENRKPIARTSNLGYTAFISPSGIVESIIKGNHLSSIVQKN
jgi:apolipoprotein N-acyltransferase